MSELSSIIKEMVYVMIKVESIAFLILSNQ